MYYEKFLRKSDNQLDFSVNHDSNSEIGAVHVQKDKSVPKISYEEVTKFNYLIENMCPDWRISMEATPFDDLGASFDEPAPDEGGGEAPAQDAGGGDMGQNPFDSMPGGDEGGGDMGEGNPFADLMGGEGGEQEEGEQGEGQEEDPMTVNREQVKLNANDLSVNIRKLIPKNFIQMKSVIQSNIQKLEKIDAPNKETQDAINDLISVYMLKLDYLDDFVSTLDERTYDEMFVEYLSSYTDMKKLMDKYVQLMKSINPGKKTNKTKSIEDFQNQLEIIPEEDSPQEKDIHGEI